MDAPARTPSAISSAIANLGAGLLGTVSQVGYGIILLGRALLAVRAVFYKSREILRQMFICGIASLPVTMLVALFTGMVLALQVGIELMRYGAKAEIGKVVAASMCREMGPIWTGVILAARVGSAMAAELGTMKVSEEIDALEVMSINVPRFLVMPRLVALMIMAPVLTVYANIVGVIGGGLVGYYQMSVSYHVYFNKALDVLTLTDIFGGLVKSLVFGTTIAIVGCSEGLRATEGAVGVGRATRRSVVVSLILILVFNYFITSFIRHLY